MCFCPFVVNNNLWAWRCFGSFVYKLFCVSYFQMCCLIFFGHHFLWLVWRFRVGWYPLLTGSCHCAASMPTAARQALFANWISAPFSCWVLASARVFILLATPTASSCSGAIRYELAFNTFYNQSICHLCRIYEFFGLKMICWFRFSFFVFSWFRVKLVSKYLVWFHFGWLWLVIFLLISW